MDQIISHGGISFVLGCSFIVISIMLALSIKNPVLITVGSILILIVGATFGIGELNTDNETRQIYGKIFILFISVLSGALISSAIAEMRANKFGK